MDFRCGEIWYVFFNDYVVDFVFFIFCLYYCDVSYRRVGDLYFGVIQDVSVVIVFNIGYYFVWVRVMVGFSQAEVFDKFFVVKFWQIFVFLFFRGVFLNWVYYE